MIADDSLIQTGKPCLESCLNTVMLAVAMVCNIIHIILKDDRIIQLFSPGNEWLGRSGGTAFDSSTSCEGQSSRGDVW